MTVEPAHGYIYTIKIFRSNADDSAEGTLHDGTDEAAIEQVAKELQEAIDETGLPTCFFEVIDRTEAMWADWDEVRRPALAREVQNIAADLKGSPCP